MRVYTVIREFDITPLNVTATVGTTIGKLDGEVVTVIGTSEWTNRAFYDWVGHPNSAEELQFTGVVPDPPTGSSVPRTPVAVPATPTSPGVQGTWSIDGTYF